MEKSPVATNVLLKWIGTFGADPNKVAQVAHAEAGFIATAALGWWGFAGILAWGIPKEAWLDPKYEDAPFFWSGALDLSFYLLGAALGLVYHHFR